MKLNIQKIDEGITRLGLSKPQFAEKIGITKQGIYYIFRTESTSFGMIDKIAAALDMDGKDLLE